MSDREHDPSASTEMFRAFVDDEQRTARGSRRSGVPVMPLVLAGVVAVALVAWLLV